MREIIEVKKRNGVGLRLELRLEYYLRDRRKGLLDVSTHEVNLTNASLEALWLPSMAEGPHRP